MLSYTANQLMRYFKISSQGVGNIASCYLSGCCVGTIIWGYLGSIIFGVLAYKYGRKALFSITLLIYLFSICVVCFSSNVYVFAIGRFLSGISVGGEYTAIFAAIDEFIPSNFRGRADIIIDGSW